ncbi:hypothetical protein [Bacillus toyonensis]|uniref:hypothetical protein n=1 Tax=Bacillus toyonensis TaxID=155322 RepID=UPI000BF32502|nr:hypothetical protein [Bacillus toyonensis]PGF04991.1 hypothetical protein COM61_00710 [Bacillus toyonensis]
MTLVQNQEVFFNMNLGVNMGYVHSLDGQNVYLRVGNDPVKLHIDQVIVINPNRYYITKQILRKETQNSPVVEYVIGVGNNKLERSNKQQTEKLIDDSGLTRKEQVFDKSTGYYNGGEYWSSVKGSVLIKRIKSQLGVAV